MQDQAANSLVYHVTSQTGSGDSLTQAAVHFSVIFIVI
jgi:hypothetical protein